MYSVSVTIVPLPLASLHNSHLYNVSAPSSQAQETNMLITTILDVQPRMASTGGGKTNDEIVAELAENILGKLPEKLDPDNGLPVLFEPNEKGIINSLSTVLLQEIDRFNRLLKVIKVRVRTCVHTVIRTHIQCDPCI